MAQACEFSINVAEVRDSLTKAADAMILRRFNGFFRYHGVGGYLFKNRLETITESSIRWTIATRLSAEDIGNFMCEFSRAYCHLGDQESVYFSIDGLAYLVNSDGEINEL